MTSTPAPASRPGTAPPTGPPAAGAPDVPPLSAARPTTSPTRSPRPGAARRVRTRWAGVPLVARLVGITTVLLAVGLVLAGTASATLLRRTLVEQVDSKLVTEGKAFANDAFNPFSPRNTGLATVPSDYYVVYTDSSGVSTVVLRGTVTREYGTPDVPDLSIDEVIDRSGEPFTTGSDEAGSLWRMVMYPVYPNESSNHVVGTVAIALPLEGVEDTVRRMALALVLSGVGIVVIGAMVGGWAVRRSLRPLREIESTAAAIAAGDLSRRVATAPESTEVGRLGAALNGMLAQIEQAFGARTASEARMRRFVADASHELRTPLATIRGYGELYRMGALTEKPQVDDTMRRIEDSATRMGGLVEDLLALARLDENRPLRHDPVDLTVLAADAVSDLHALDPSRSTRLEPLTAGATTGPVLVVGEEPRLRQVLANLLGNVVQHTPAGTPVEIAIGVVPGPAGTSTGVVEVRDHGPGIDPDHAARVFERFYRIDAARGRDSGGAGLGMAIVAAIVESHGGTVGLAQTPGGGTTVRVALPVHVSGSSNAAST
ncbi:sensor histidine kinase [Cellulomonas sp. URHB0016]